MRHDERMFDSSRYAALNEAFDAVVEMPHEFADTMQTRAALRTLQAMSDRAEGLRARLLRQMDETGAYADDGASSTLSWARRELRLSAASTARLRAAGRTMQVLPGVGEAMLAGEIRLDHVAQFTGGLRRVDTAVLADATQQILLPLAKQAAPSDLAVAIDRLDEVTHPSKVDEAWRRGMDRRDVQVTRAGDGYHLAGFVDIVLGAKLASFLVAASAPRSTGPGEADGPAGSASCADERPASQRRTDALHELLDTAIADGIPGDKGVRPQLHVTVEAEWLSHQPGSAPPTLQGYGVIGPDLYGYLACEGDHTTVLTHGTTSGRTPYAAVLNVGRTRRLATRAQRVAVRVQQDGHCAAPGCSHTNLELHHVSWWERDGGRTDLVNLVGLCRACHLAVHAGRLGVERDEAGGFVFRRLHGPSRRAIEDRDRIHRRRFRDYLHALGVARDGAFEPASRQQVTAPCGSLERHRAGMVDVSITKR